jgi:hypothetical protein
MKGAPQSQSPQRLLGTKGTLSLCVGICGLISGIFGNVSLQAQDSDSNIPPAILSGRVVVNLCEKFEKGGSLEYSLSLPDGVLRKNDRQNQGIGEDRPGGRQTWRSTNFARLYEADRLYWKRMLPELEAE